VVIGGGLAGITAAVALGKAGHQVTLLEAKPRRGCSASSARPSGIRRGSPRTGPPTTAAA
jgi:phytoene dehydrogenase-like protein